MTINWPVFIPALILLLTPIGIFHGRKVRYRSLRSDWDRHWPQIFSLGLHAIDLTRAALGGWLLINVLKAAAGPATHWWQPVVLQWSVILIAVILQVRICKEERALNAPFAYFVGLVFGLYPPQIAGFPLLLATVAAAGSRTPAAFFPVLSVLLVGLGALFSDLKISYNLIYGAVVILLPWLWSLLFSRTLVITYRAKSTADTTSPLKS